MPFKNLLNISVQKDWIDYLSALLTPAIALLTSAIAVFGICIAYMQWRTEEARRRHELFDRRLKQFDAVVKFALSTTSLSIEADEECECRPSEASNKLDAEIYGMKFIFSPDIDEYVKTYIVKLHQEIQGLRSKRNIIRERNMMNPGEELEKNADEQNELKNNLRKNLEIFHEKTLEYMQLEQPSITTDLWRYLKALFEKIKNAPD